MPTYCHVTRCCCNQGADCNRLCNRARGVPPNMQTDQENGLRHMMPQQQKDNTATYRVYPVDAGNRSRFFPPLLDVAASLHWHSSLVRSPPPLVPLSLSFSLHLRVCTHTLSFSATPPPMIMMTAMMGMAQFEERRTQLSQVSLSDGENSQKAEKRGTTKHPRVVPGTPDKSERGRGGTFPHTGCGERPGHGVDGPNEVMKEG